MLEAAYLTLASRQSHAPVWHTDCKGGWGMVCSPKRGRGVVDTERRLSSAHQDNVLSRSEHILCHPKAHGVTGPSPGPESPGDEPSGLGCAFSGLAALDFK